ncbi:hypothetical protein JCM5296_005916 [Sporobolomyces johnsonii]
MASDPAPDSPPAVLPTLPTEIWQRIIAFASGPPSFDSPTRQPLLARCSLVNRTWQHWTQKQLFKEPTLSSWEQAQSFERVLAEEHDKSCNEKVDLPRPLGAAVRVLRLGTEWGALEQDKGGAKYQLDLLLQHCTSLDALFIGLCAVHLWEVSFASSGFSGFSLPNVRHLTMLDVCRIFCDVEAVYADTKLPSPDKLAITSYSPGLPFDNLHLYTSLAFVHAPVETLRVPGTLDLLPPSLRFLRITSGHFFGSDFLTPFFVAHPDALPKLEDRILPMRLQTAAAFVELRAWAGAMGVRLTWEKDEEGPGTAHDEGFWSVVRRVEKTLEREARDASE